MYLSVCLCVSVCLPVSEKVLVTYFCSYIDINIYYVYVCVENTVKRCYYKLNALSLLSVSLIICPCYILLAFCSLYCSNVYSKTCCFCCVLISWLCNKIAREFNTCQDLIYNTVSQKKTSHSNFRHNFAICWDIFTIFEVPCSGIIAGWCNLLHTHYQCEAFTWRDVTYDVIQAVVRRAHRHQISYHLTYGLWTHRT